MGGKKKNITLFSWSSDETNREAGVLERLSVVHKVISSSQRAFTVEGGEGKATRFHIKAKVPDTLTIVALMLRSTLWLAFISKSF